MTAQLPAATSTQPGTVPVAGRRVDGALLGFIVATYALPWAVWWSQIAQQRGAA